LQVVSSCAAQAIDRTRLHEESSRAREAAEAEHRRIVFLADTSRLLGSSLDYPTTLASIASTAVPRIADWCIVELADGDGDAPAPLAAHVDPSKVEHVLELARRYRASGRMGGLAGVIETGKAKFYRTIVRERVLEALADVPELAQLYLATGMTSAMIVPIATRGRTLGAILLVSTGRRYEDDDLVMAEELGRRAGLAVDNARLYRDAMEADRRKDEFLALLGHELRNPLAPIVTALDVMALSGNDAFLRERQTLSRAVKRVVRLVDDLLDVPRLTSGRIELEKEVVETAQLLRRAVETASSSLEQRRQSLAITVPEDGLPLLVDPSRIAQAITNLLINASKYTPPRGKIELGASREGADVVIRVRDSGSGIAPDMLSSVFDLFVQAKAPLDRSAGGLGIGLAIVKSLVELHGGSVSAASEGLGKGSEFTIRLALAQDVQAPAREQHAAPAEQRWRVLIVDDNADAAWMLSAALESIGCVTQVACDGPAALAAAPAFAPELILLDIGLPVMDGYELARRFREMEITARTRLVAVTGYGETSDRRRSVEAGFDGHLVKPVELDTLCAIVKQLEDAGARPSDG
jgi:signal transduction histidine kinase/CheY-like chemotaxis protein